MLSYLKGKKVFILEGKQEVLCPQGAVPTAREWGSPEMLGKPIARHDQKKKKSDTDVVRVKIIREVSVVGKARDESHSLCKAGQSPLF